MTLTADTPTQTKTAQTQTAQNTTGQPVLDGRRRWGHQLVVYVFILGPLLALAAAVPFAWGWGLSLIHISEPTRPY